MATDFPNTLSILALRLHDKSKSPPPFPAPRIATAIWYLAKGNLVIDGLPRGVRSKVFQRIVEQLKTDPLLSRLIKRWNVWDKPISPVASAGTETELQLTPRLGATGWYSPDSHVGPLQIQVDLWAPGNKKGLYNAVDALDLWEAIEGALYQPDITKRKAFKRELQCLGAETGEIQFSQPATVQSAGENGVVQVGLMQLNVRRNINP